MNRNAVLACGVPIRRSDGHREDRAGPDADPVDRGHDRLRAGPQRLDHRAGHAGEGEQLRHRAPRQRLDDLEHVAARAEIAAGAGQHDRLDVLGMAQRLEGALQLGVALEGQRILALGPVERERRDLVLDRPAEVLCRADDVPAIVALDAAAPPGARRARASRADAPTA